MSIWNTVKTMKSQMTILLTTHSMEEADALCARIAILTNQGIQCIGSQIHLKNKYGRGLMLSVNLDPSILNVSEFMKMNVSKDLELVETRGSVATFTIDKEKVDLDHFLRCISTFQQKRLLIRWNLSQSSLDDVFLRVCRHEDPTENK